MKYIDLTHVIKKDMPVFPGDPPVEITHPMTLGKDIAAVQSIRFNNHVGTHVDAPSHFIEQGMTVDEIPLDTLMGEAVVLDFMEKSEGGTISKKDFETRLKNQRKQSRIIIKTGWDKHFHTGDFYEGFPCLSLDAAHYLVAQNIRVLGMDMPSPSPFDDPGQAIHKTLLGSGIILVESLNNLTKIPGRECFLMIMPLPFKNFSGSPCRAVALACKNSG